MLLNLFGVAEIRVVTTERVKERKYTGARDNFVKKAGMSLRVYHVIILEL